MAEHGSIAVIGDLTVDVRFKDAQVTSGRSALETDTTVTGTPATEIGGSALLFARAARDGLGLSPLIVSAVGDDPMGRFVFSELAAESLEASGVQVIDNVATTTVALAYLSGSRLMVRPRTHASLHAEWGTAVEAIAGAVDLRAVFVSGYSLVDASSGSFATAVEAVRWADVNDVPVVVDFVPHDFAAAVGGIAETLDTLGGPVAVGIMELKTAIGLDQVADTATDLPAAAELASKNLLDFFGASVVQFQAAEHLYAQSVSSMLAPQDTRNDQEPFLEETRTGTGDRLACLALRDLLADPRLLEVTRLRRAAR